MPASIAIPTDWAPVRMVPRVAEAMPNLSGVTESITELTLGDEKKPWPIPTIMRGIQTSEAGDDVPRKERAMKPIDLEIIPAELRILAENLSERVPAIGAEIT